ncbi:MAG: hypothetical protein AAFX92_08970 [Pseudomonadota bacterium]
MSQTIEEKADHQETIVMTFRAEMFPVIGLSCAVLLTSSLTHVPSIAANNLFPPSVDPPVLVTNLSGNLVQLQWQTVGENSALSPVRGASVPVDARAALADEGLFWFYDPANGGAVENIVFVSIVDDDGAILSQVVMEEEIAGTIEAIEETALHITIGTDGTLDLSVHDVD